MRTNPERRLRNRGPDGVVYPDYAGHCFTNVPGSIGKALDVELGRSVPGETIPTDDIDTVICVLLDGLGIERFRRDGDSVSLLRRLSDAGTVSTLTAPFPSETAAAIASFHTARSPAAHGLLGGLLWCPAGGRVLKTLRFAVPGGEPESGIQHGLDPGILNEGDTIHQRLTDAGVASHCVQPTPTTTGTYTDAFLAGATRHGYDDPTEAGRLLRRSVTDAAGGPSFTYCYLPHVDITSHAHGPADDRYRMAMRDACAGVESGLDAIQASNAVDADRTLVVLLADHGHVSADPERFTRFDADPVIADAMAAGPPPAALTGGPRSVFFHLPSERLDGVRRRLERRYDGHVFTRTEALDELGLFGPDPGVRARARCGDLVFVPGADGAGGELLAGEKRSYHGGLSEREMLVPLIAARLGDFD